MEKLKILLIGLGNMGKIHKRILENNFQVEIVGIVEKDKTKHKEVSKYKFYKDISEINFEELIIDGAVVSTNTDSHYKIAKLLIEKNIPVFVEKPLTTSKKEFNKITKLAKENSSVLRCGLIEIYNPIFKYLKNLNIKNIYNIHIFRESQKMKERKLDNILFDLTLHDFSVLVHLFGKKDIEIISINSRSDIKKIECIDVSIKINNIPILISTSRESQNKIRNWKILAKNKQCDVDLINKNIEIFSSGSASLEGDQLVKNRSSKSNVSFINSEETGKLQMESFINNINSKKLDMNHFNLVVDTHEFIFNLMKKVNG